MNSGAVYCPATACEALVSRVAIANANMKAAYSQIASQPLRPMRRPRSWRSPGASTSAAAPLRTASSQNVLQAAPRIKSPALLHSSAAAKTCAVPVQRFSIITYSFVCGKTKQKEAVRPLSALPPRTAAG